VADFFAINVTAYDATGEELPLLLFDFTYPNFCCRVDFARNANQKNWKLLVYDNMII